MDDNEHDHEAAVFADLLADAKLWVECGDQYGVIALWRNDFMRYFNARKQPVPRDLFTCDIPTLVDLQKCIVAETFRRYADTMNVEN
jgi:hypothetical protein